MVTLTCQRCGAWCAAVQLPQLDATGRTMLKTLSAFAGGVDLAALLTDAQKLSSALGVQCAQGGCANE